MDKRGVKSKTQANREKAFMSRVFRWGYERGLCKGNPCKGVKQFKEVALDRYVTDEEYNALYSVAAPVVKVAMEIAYLCLSRQGDVLSLTEGQILEQGIFIAQGKTGAKQIKAWTDRLRAAVNNARSLPIKPGISSMYLIHQATGGRYTRDGFNSRWQQAKEDAAAAFPHLSFDFTFHDLKAKGVSDLDGTLAEKQAISGHMTISQTARYDRKIPIVPVVGGQNKNS
ncbi:integrase [Brenneria salicis ATCC 15712 = DSM 30166]|nr:integrase [Brenneria salicis ATCC 15712 = DSM 30166]